MDISASKIGADMDMLSVGRLRVGIDNGISASKIGADMDMLPARPRARSLRALPDKDISASRIGIEPVDISASKIGADMNMLSVRRLWDGIDKDNSASKIGTDMDMLSVRCLRTSSASRIGIDFIDISASKIGADMEMPFVRCLRMGMDNEISASNIGADMDMLPAKPRARSLRALPSGSATGAGLDKDISASTISIDPMDNSASIIGADMDMLSVMRLRDGIDKGISASKKGTDVGMFFFRDLRTSSSSR